MEKKTMYHIAWWGISTRKVEQDRKPLSNGQISLICVSHFDGKNKKKQP